MDLQIATAWRSFDNAIHKKHATRLVQSAAPATQNDYGSLQSAAPATKNAPRLLKTMRKYCPYHTERLPTRCETCWNVTKCRACHTKQGYATFETSKSDYFCSTTPNENPSLHIREKCFLGRYRYQPTKYAVVVVKLLQSDEMYPKVSDNTSGENPWTNGVHRILSGRLIRIKKHLQCEAEVVGSCATQGDQHAKLSRKKCDFRELRIEHDLGFQT